MTFHHRCSRLEVVLLFTISPHNVDSVLANICSTSVLMIVVITYSLSSLYERFPASMVQHSAHLQNWPPACGKMQLVQHNIPTSRNHYPTSWSSSFLLLPPIFFLLFIAWPFTSHTYGIVTATLNKFEPYSWLLFGFKYCKSSSPTPYSIFATLKLFKMGLMGQINDPCPSSTGATCSLFSYASWLLWQWSLVMAVSLG